MSAPRALHEVLDRLVDEMASANDPYGTAKALFESGESAILHLTLGDKEPATPVDKLLRCLIDHFWHDEHTELEVWDFQDLLVKCGLAVAVDYDPSIPAHAQAMAGSDEIDPGDTIYLLTEDAQHALARADGRDWPPPSLIEGNGQ
jgi:hypothetical protein